MSRCDKHLNALSWLNSLFKVYIVESVYHSIKWRQNRQHFFQTLKSPESIPNSLYSTVQHLLLTFLCISFHMRCIARPMQPIIYAREYIMYCMQLWDESVVFLRLFLSANYSRIGITRARSLGVLVPSVRQYTSWPLHLLVQNYTSWQILLLFWFAEKICYIKHKSN